MILKRVLVLGVASAMVTSLSGVAGALAAQPVGGAVAPARIGTGEVKTTATPIKHLVVIYDENVSFDHYFATYPEALNPPGEPRFTALPDTPWVSNLLSAHLLTNNPNFTNRANGTGAANPFRLDRSQAATSDQDHGYTAEQRAYDHGKADLFPKYAGRAERGASGVRGTPGMVMGYFDGNTVTALWNYAQHFALSDNAHGNTYGPSTPGALEVAAGQTNGERFVAGTKTEKTKAGAAYVENGIGGLSMIGDLDPGHDVCSTRTNQVMMGGDNIGDLLNAAGITWGGFMGGFDLATKNANRTTGCGRSTYSTVMKRSINDYIPHHDWFQYYAATANPTHARPRSIGDIGYSFAPDGTRDPANHEYGLQDFYNAVKAGDFPAVSYIKLPAYQDGHAGYSNPLDEQAGIARVIDFVMRQPEWKDTAIIIAYDDSDGWYDHGFSAPTNPSFDKVADQLDGPGRCGIGTPLPGINGQPVNGRCGLGPRLPFLVISPWAKPDYVSHTEIDQASVIRFIEDNWLGGERLGEGSFDASAGSIMGMFDFTATGGKTPALLLDAASGEVVPVE
ncbi:MAG: phospholipase C [Acetobacteraceae bacterium]